MNLVLDQKGRSMHGSSVLPNAAAEADSLAWIFVHPAILNAVRTMTNLEKLVFTGESDVHRNFLLGVWHKDSGEGNMPNGYFDCDAMAADDCLVYKVALYLQDHVDGTGLTVRSGSTRVADLNAGDERSVAVRAGDMILFDVRITHRGSQPTKVDLAINRLGESLKWRWFEPVPPLLRRLKYKLTGRPDRLAVYFAFGASNPKKKMFARRNMRRQLQQLDLEWMSTSLPVAARVGRVGG